MRPWYGVSVSHLHFETGLCLLTAGALELRSEEAGGAEDTGGGIKGDSPCCTISSASP